MSPRTAEPEPVEPEGEAVLGEPVEGEVVAFIPSEAQQAATADRARGRTAVQVGIPAALVGIGSWLARLYHVDLDPGAGTDLPADVAGYFVAVIAYVLVVVMNPKPKP